MDYTGVFGYTFAVENPFPWIVEYLEGVDNLLIVENGSLLLNPNLWIDTNPTETQLLKLRMFVKTEIIKNAYELQKLIDTLNLEYNPIYNVEEYTTEKYIGDGIQVFNKQENGSGKNKSINELTGKEKSDENTHGLEITDGTTKNTYGTYTENTNHTTEARTDVTSTTYTNAYGRTAGTFTEVGNVAPMDSDIFHSNTQTINNHNEDAHTDNLNQETKNQLGAQKSNDIHTINARDDIAKINDQYTNTSTISRNTLSSQNDVNTSSYSNNIITKQDGVTTTSYAKEITRKGNIGIISAMQLIQQEREIAKISIYDMLKTIFVSNLCITCYPDSVARDTPFNIPYGWGCSIDYNIL